MDAGGFTYAGLLVLLGILIEIVAGMLPKSTIKTTATLAGAGVIAGGIVWGCIILSHFSMPELLHLTIGA